MGTALAEDVNEILPGLYLGSFSFESGPLSRLQRRNITHVVQVGWYMQASHPDALEYLCLRIQDDDSEELVGLMRERGVLPYIDATRASGGAVLVHCQMGMSRSATIVIAYLRFCDQLERLEACGGINAYTPEPPRAYSGKEMAAREQRWLEMLDSLRPDSDEAAQPLRQRRSMRTGAGLAVLHAHGRGLSHLQRRLRKLFGRS